MKKDFMGKKMSSILMLISITALLLSACGGNNPASPSSQTSTTPSSTTTLGSSNSPDESSTGKPVKISIMNGLYDMPANVDPNDNKWTNIFKESFPNLEIEWILLPRDSAQFNQKKQMLMGAGDFPNLVLSTKTDMINWANSGIIIPVDDLIGEHVPNLKRYLSDEDMRNVTYLGKKYAIPAPTSSLQNPTVTYIRKDWLDKLQLPMPETTEQFMEVMKAFTEQDPDGNNKNDTYGFASQKNLVFMDNTLAFPFGVNLDTQSNSINWQQVDGKLIPDFITPGAKQALAYFRDMYASGVYDKESMVLDYSKLEEKITSGKYGAASFLANATRGRIAANIKKSDPNAELVLLPPLKGAEGQQGLPRGDNISMYWTITQGTTPEQAEAIAKLLNWFMEPDPDTEYTSTMGDRINMGEVGVHSSLLGGKYLEEIPDSQLTPEALADKYRFSYRLMYSSSHMLPDPERIEYSKLADEVKPGFYEDVKANAEFGIYNKMKIAGSVTSQYLPDLITYFDEMKMKIVTGSESIDAFEKWVDYFYKNHGQEIIDEVNQMNS
ncbi:extracellular solute-binding protein [Paenibacillus sp. GXUN7292]|uniref:extracellular solute-binding protein n=1 Tax=Paenibacillus sp. GXUN7292 TaxID=3422499 RepID=UPI003D7E4C77